MGDVPNKTIYVADADLPLFERAQELTGDNLSATIVRALRRLVEIEEGRAEGFEEITVRVGTGAGQRQRFVGVLLVEELLDQRTGGDLPGLPLAEREVRAAPQAFVGVGLTAGPDGQAMGWRKHFASDQQWGTLPKTASWRSSTTWTRSVSRCQQELFILVEAAAEQPVVVDLDI